MEYVELRMARNGRKPANTPHGAACSPSAPEKFGYQIEKSSFQDLTEPAEFRQGKFLILFH